MKKFFVWTFLVLLVSLSGRASAASASGETNSVFKTERFPTVHFIGFANADYADEVGPIPNAHRDIKLFADVIELMRKTSNSTNRRFDVRNHIDSKDYQFTSRLDFSSRIKTNLEGIKRGDVVVFYFSGHGFMFNNQNFISGIGMRADFSQENLRSNTIAIEEIVEYISSFNKGQIIVVLDACRSEAVIKAETGKPFSPGSFTDSILGSFKSDDPSDVVVFFSTSTNNPSFAPTMPDTPSFYTKALYVAISRIADKIAGAAEAGEFQFPLNGLSKLIKAELAAEAPTSSTLGDPSFGFVPSDSYWKNVGGEWLDLLSNPEEPNLLESAKRYQTVYPWSQYRQSVEDFIAQKSVQDPLKISADAITGPLAAFAAQDGSSLSLAGDLIVVGEKEGGAFLSFNPVSVDRSYEIAAKANEATPPLAAVSLPPFPIRFPRDIRSETFADLARFDDSDLGIVLGANKSSVEVAAAKLPSAESALRQLRAFDQLTVAPNAAVSIRSDKTRFSDVVASLPELSTVRIQQDFTSQGFDTFIPLDVGGSLINDSNRPIVVEKSVAQQDTTLWLQLNVDPKFRTTPRPPAIIGRPLGEFLLASNAIENMRISGGKQELTGVTRALSGKSPEYWLSIAAGPVDGECENSVRTKVTASRRANAARMLAISSLKRRLREQGIDTRRVSSVSGDCGVSEGEFRIRVFGF